MKETTKSGGQSYVNLEQDPSDFAALASGKEIVADDTKVKSTEGTDSDSKKDDQPAEHPDDNGEKTPDEKKPAKEEAAKKPPTNEAKPPVATKTDAKAGSKQKYTAEEFRKREADKIIQQKGEQAKRLFLAAVDMVRENPAALLNIAKYDRTQADAIVKEIYGYESVDELEQQTRLLELKKEDPEKADTEERLMRLEKDTRAVTRSQQEQLDKMFFESKGLQYNSVDPDCVAVMENLKKLDPTFVKNDRAGALNLAHQMALGQQSRVTPEMERLQEKLNEEESEGSGNGINAGHESPSPYDEKQNAFASLVGTKLT